MGLGEILSIAIAFCTTENCKEKAGNHCQTHPGLVVAKQREKAKANTIWVLEAAKNTSFYNGKL